MFYEHIFPYHVQDNNDSNNFTKNSSNDNLNDESLIYNDAKLEVPNLREIPHNDQTSGHIESLPIKEVEYTSQTESEPIEKKRVSIDDMNEEVTNDSKKESSSESEREILSEGDPQNIRRIRRP